MSFVFISIGFVLGLVVGTVYHTQIKELWAKVVSKIKK